MSLRLGIPALMATGDVGVSLCLSCSLTQSLPVPAACRRQWDAAPLRWAALAAAARAGGCCQELGDSCRNGWGCTGETPGAVLGAASPSLPRSPCICADTPGTLPGKWPLLMPPLQQHCIPPVGHRDRQLGGLLTLLHFGYRSQGVKFAMPAPPAAGDFFSSPTLSCFSVWKCICVVYLTLPCGHRLYSLCLGSYHTSQSLFTAWLF